MKCDKIQALILTDYLDEQLDGQQKEVVEQHIVSCPDCKRYAETAKKVAIDPLKQAEKLNAPDSVWSSIRQTILEEQRQKKNVFVAAWERLRSPRFLPQPVFAFASVVVIILLAATLVPPAFMGQRIKKIDTQGQIEYLSYLVQEPAEVTLSDNNGLGTSIEEYFL